MKKIISVLLCIMMIVPFSALINVNAEGGQISSVIFNVYEGETNAIDAVKAQKNGNDFYMYLPGNTDCSKTHIVFGASQDVSIDDVNVGKDVVFDASAEGITIHKLSCGDTQYRLITVRSSKIPSVYITTESGSLSYIHANKENKESGNIRIYDNDSKLSLDSPLKQIKGRGNSTWGLAKKPYNIKFDSKTSVLGMPKAKKWTLLANHYDFSIIRNMVAYTLAEETGLPYTSDFRTVDLYINNEYMGNYLICESVEAGDNRVEVTDLDKANEKANPGIDLETLPLNSSGGELAGSRKWVEIPNNPADISGGYILEFDYQNRYNKEISGFETNRGQCVTIKSPELASKEEVEYIASYYQQAEDALGSADGYNKLGKHYTEYFDMQSLATMYLLEELSMDCDAGQTSFYLTKNAGDDKFYVAPAWDFDASFGNNNAFPSKLGFNITNPEIWFANQNYYSRNDDYKWSQAEIECFFTFAFENQAGVRQAAKESWKSFRNVFNDEFIDFVSQLGSDITASAIMNNLRWNRCSISNAESYYENDLNILVNFLTKRMTFLDKGMDEKSAFIYYNSNGAAGKVIDPQLYYQGDKVTLLSPTYKYDFRLKTDDLSFFKEWNTKPDGSGKSYKPGDVLTFDSDEIHLYAIWTNFVDPGTGDDDDNGGASDGFFAKIISFFRSIIDWFRNLFR